MRIRFLAVTMTLTVAMSSLLAETVAFDSALRFEAIRVLRQGFASEEFWPSMHAAEGMTKAGLGETVIWDLKDRLLTEENDQCKCGLARETIRAGKLDPVSILRSVLCNEESDGRIHAAESSFKVHQVGDAEVLRKAVSSDDVVFGLMAAAALVRSGETSFLSHIREALGSDESRDRRIAAWILGQIGDRSDWARITPLTQSETEPLAIGFVWNALAKLGAPGAVEQVVKNLASDDKAVRTYSAQTLGVCGLPSHLPLLKAELSNENLDTAIRAAEAIVCIGNRQLAEDRDEDGIPDAVESVLGTSADSAAAFSSIHGPKSRLVTNVDPESIPAELKEVRFAHAGGEKYIWELQFRTAISELRTIIHIYVRLDDDKATGRQDESSNKGVDVMYTFRSGKSNPNIFTPQLRSNPKFPIRAVVAGNRAWVCDDVKMGRAEGKTDFGMHILTERYPHDRAPEKVGWMTPQLRVKVPLSGE